MQIKPGQIIHCAWHGQLVVTSKTMSTKFYVVVPDPVLRLHYAYDFECRLPTI